MPADDEKGPDGKLLHPDATPKGLEQLQAKTWDAVIDNSGYYPRMVKASGELLATIADPTVETMGANFENYGALKALCEKAAEAAFPGRAAITGDFTGFHTWSNARALKAGMNFRPLSDTVAATLAWFPGEVERRVKVTKELQDAAKAKGAEPSKLPDPRKLKAGPTPEREAELLAKWKAERPQPVS